MTLPTTEQRTLEQRRDKSDKTPPFMLTHANHMRLGEVIAMCGRCGVDPTASIEHELEVLHRDWLYRYRPIAGLARSLDGIGFAEDWDANRNAHMAEAWAAWARVQAPERWAA